MIKQSKKNIKIMLQHAKGPTIALIIIMILSSAFTSLQILITKNLVDSMAEFMRGISNFTVVGFWALLMLLSILFNSMNGYFNYTIDISLTKSLMQNFMPKILNKFKMIEYSCFENSETHDIIMRMSNNPQDKIKQNFFFIVNALKNLLVLIGLLIYFVNVSAWFAIVYIIIISIVIYIDIVSVNMMNELFYEQTIEERKMGYLSSLLSEKNALFELKIFNAIQYISDKWGALTSLVLKERKQTSIKSQKLNIISSIIMSIWAVFLLIFIGNGVIDGKYTIGLLIALITTINQLFAVSEEFSYNFSRAAKTCFEIKYYDDFMNLPQIKTPQNEEDDYERGSIIFDNVYFKYPGTDRNVLNGMSFTINPHEKVALVGVNGAGKSTIVKLLCGLYSPDSGQITVGTKDISELSQNQKQRLLSIVFQDFSKYSLTLRENVAFGDISLLNDDNAIRNALSKGMAEDILAQLDNELDTNLGKIMEDGVDLSGGQWQKIAISRAMISQSEFIVLDEPTAALDPVAESKMYDTFLSILNRQGALIISHRLASAKMADRILVLENGRIIESGNHDELILNENGLYKKMFKSQSDWYKEEEKNV